MAEPSTPDIVVALRRVMAALPDPDTVPVLLEMRPATFYRLEALRCGPDPWAGSVFDPYLPINFDDDLAAAAIRVTYRSGRTELLTMTGEEPGDAN